MFIEAKTYTEDELKKKTEEGRNLLLFGVRRLENKIGEELHTRGTTRTSSPYGLYILGRSATSCAKNTRAHH